MGAALWVPLKAQSPTREYIRLGSRVIAIESGFIGAVRVINITSTGATIEWTTNAPADSQVFYGLTASYGSQTTLNSALVTDHSVSLTGLTANTTYHFKVSSAPSGGTAQQSADNSFKTNTSTGLTISAVQASGVTSSAATIQWTTSPGGTSQVDYGLTSSYGSQSTLNPTLLTTHSVALSGLAPSTTYHFRVRSAPSGGGDVFSADYSFTTSAAGLLLSDVQVADILSNSVTIQWTTSVASSSQVDYGTTTAYGSQTAADSSLVTGHSVVLAGLSPNTTYHYRVRSTPSGGSEVLSQDATFTTLTASGVVISNVTASSITSTSAHIQWTTNVPATSQVNFGTTVGYGQMTVLDSTLTTTHTQTLTGLVAGTTYHYRVVSAPQSGYSVASGDNSFSTAGTLVIQTAAGATAVYLNLGQTIQFNAYINGSTSPSNNSVTWTVSPVSPQLVVQDAAGLFRAVNSTHGPSYMIANITATLNSNSSIHAYASILLNPDTVSQTLWMEPNPAGRLLMLHWGVASGYSSQWNQSQYIFIGDDLAQPTSACEMESPYWDGLILYNPGGTNSQSQVLSQGYSAQKPNPILARTSLENSRCTVVLDTAEAYYQYNGVSTTASTDRIINVPVEAKSGFGGTKRVYRKRSSDSAYQEVGAWGQPATTAPPTFSVSPGSYAAGQTLEINSLTPSALVRYTTDGSTPSRTNGTLCVRDSQDPAHMLPLTLTSSVTIKAIAYTSNTLDSSVATGAYTITSLPFDLVVTSVPAGTTTFKALNSITAGTGVTVNGTNKAVFEAGATVRLLPGFQATAGSSGTTFRAFINPQVQ